MYKFMNIHINTTNEKKSFKRKCFLFIESYLAYDFHTYPLSRLGLLLQPQIVKFPKIRILGI